MDDIGLHPAFSEPARQPEAVTPGLIGNDNALKRPTRFCGLVPPTLQKPEQRVPLRLKFLQRLAVNPGHDPGHKPACLAHLDHHNQGAILLKGSEGSAQVVRLWHGGTSSVLSSDDRASPLAAPHSIYSVQSAETEQATQTIAISALKLAVRAANALAARDVEATAAIAAQSRDLKGTPAPLPIPPLIQTEMFDSFDRWREGLATTG